MHLLDVAQQILRLDEVVARVEVAVVLERQGAAARLVENAHRRRQADPRRQRGVEHLHEHASDIRADPFVEDADQKAPPLLRAHRSIRHLVPLEHVQGARFATALAPAAIGERQHLRGHALDDRDELEEFGPELVPEEAVDIVWMVAVGRVHGAEDVDVDAVLLEQTPASNHAIERALAAFVHAIGVVQRARSVDAQPDEIPVRLEERRPLIVQSRAVGLNGVGECLVWSLVALGIVRRALEEVEAHQCRLAALPGDVHLGPRLGFEQLADVGLEQLVRHPKAASRVEHFFREEKAVSAVEIAHRARRLRQHVEVGEPTRRHRESFVNRAHRTPPLQDMNRGVRESCRSRTSC